MNQFINDPGHELSLFPPYIGVEKEKFREWTRSAA